jgi:PPOX class probable F420-dependent enzyme
MRAWTAGTARTERRRLIGLPAPTIANVPREQVSMTDAEVASFLAENRTAILATNASTGYPHQSAMWYLHEDTTIRMWTYRSSQKVVNLRNDPRATILVESGDDYLSLRGVLLIGRIALIDDFDRALGVGIGLRQRYADPDRPATADALASRARKRIVLELRPERIVSWDHRRQKAHS